MTATLEQLQAAYERSPERQKERAAAEVARAKILDRRAALAAGYAKTRPPLEAAYAAAVAAVGPAMQTARDVEAAAQRARAELRGATVSFEQRDAELVRELRAGADPQLRAYAEEIADRREAVLLGLAVADGANRGRVAVRLMQLSRFVGEELVLLPTPAALEALEAVRAEVGTLTPGAGPVASRVVRPASQW